MGTLARNGLKYPWNIYTNNETTKITCSAGIYKTISLIGSYPMLFAKTQWESFENL